MQKGVNVSRLSGTESVMGQRDKFEFYALLNRKPVKMFKNTRSLCVCVVGERDRQRLWALPSVVWSRWTRLIFFCVVP